MKSLSPNSCEVESAISGLKGSGSPLPFSFPSTDSSFLLDDNSRRLFFRVAQPRRCVSATFDAALDAVRETLGVEATRMLSLEGGPALVTHVLARPWTKSVPASLVEQTIGEVEQFFRLYGRFELIDRRGRMK